MDLSVVIVTWNSEDWIKRCLKSIFERTSELDFEIIVIDNDSKDLTVRTVMNQFPGVRVIRNEENVGWAAGINQGIETARGDFICVMNPDTELVDRTFEQLVGFLREYEGIGIVGPRLMNEDESIQRSVRRRPKLADQLMIILKLHVLFPDAGPLFSYLWRDFNYRETQEVEQIMGACMMIRREVFEQAGIFDENFFLWFDEVDFCRRVVERTDYRIYYNAHTHLIHAGGDSFDKLRTKRKQRIYLKSLRYYFRKHGHWFSYFLILLLTPLSLFLGWLSGLFQKSEKGKEQKEKARESFKKAD